MKLFKAKMGVRNQKSYEAQENSELQKLRCENANKNRRIEQLSTELEYQKSESQDYQNLTVRMRELLADMMTRMSQMTRQFQSRIVHHVVDKSFLISENIQKMESNVCNSATPVTNMAKENQSLNRKLQEANLKLCEAEYRLDKNRDWIANAKSVLKERELLLYDTRQLLKQKEKELRVCGAEVVNRGCDDHSMGDREGKDTDQMVLVTEAEVIETDLRETRIEPHPLLPMDSGVKQDGKPPKVDYFARFMEEVGNKKYSAKAKQEEQQPEMVAPPYTCSS